MSTEAIKSLDLDVSSLKKELESLGDRIEKIEKSEAALYAGIMKAKQYAERDEREWRKLLSGIYIFLIVISTSIIAVVWLSQGNVSRMHLVGLILILISKCTLVWWVFQWSLLRREVSEHIHFNLKQDSGQKEKSDAGA